MSVTSAPFYQEPARLRPVRFLALLLLSLAFTLVTALALLAAFPVLDTALFELLAWFPDPDSSRLAGWLTLGLIVAVPTSLLTLMWRFKLRSWWWVGGGWIAVAPVLVYLVIDEPAVRHAISFEELAPAFPDAEASFGTIMRYGKQHPEGQAFKIDLLPAPIPEPTETAAWREYALQHRARIEAEWAALAPQRNWWTELNAFDRIGDLSPPGSETEVIAFPVFRAISQRGCLFATLQAIDGHPDEAIATLLPILEVGRKMQPSARSLVRIMVGIVLERLSLRTATWIIDQGPISATSRARLASAVQGSFGEAGARRVVTIDYAGVLPQIVGTPLGDFVNTTNRHAFARFGLNLVSPFVYNRRASANLYGGYLLELQELAARRNLRGMELRGNAFFSRELRPHFKNCMGRLVINQAVPAYGKVVDSFWKTEDTRSALQAKLARW